jgi:hypothetical protein
MASSMLSCSPGAGSLVGALAFVLAAGCAAPASPVQDTTTAPIPPPPAVSAALPPAPPAPPPAPALASASAAPPSPPSVPIATTPIDRNTCRPHPPAVTFEVADDDVVVPLDAQGCPLGRSHFKFNGYGYKASVDFMTELQRLVKAGDRAGLADLANYPLRVNISVSRHLVIKDRAAFLKGFDQIYPAPVIQAILAADPRDVSCSYQGIMLGNGILWADNGAKGHYGAISINVP